MQKNSDITNLAQKTFSTIFLMGITLLVIIPFLWMLMMSFRTTGEILNDPYGLPSTINLNNFTKLLFDPEISFYRYFINSATVTTGALILTLILATMGGYGFGRSRYDFRFRGWIFALLLFALMLPPQIMYIPQFQMMTQYHLLNTHWALILLYTASALPVSTYLLATYFQSLPKELEDASRIDGASDFKTFFQVMLPLARPAIATVILINFLNFWNELLLAVTMVTDPTMRTLPAAMMLFVGENSADYGMAAASLVMAMLPVFLVYLFMADKFIEGLTGGALKG